MKINKQDMDWAVDEKIITPEQADKLWSVFSSRQAERLHFSLSNVLYYFGALIIIGAMSFFITTAWEDLGGGGIFIVASLYAGFFLFMGNKLWSKPHLHVPAGLLITIAVCITPLVMYGLQRWLDIWGFDDPGEYRSFYKWIKGGWFAMEVATIFTGLLALRFFKFPFVCAPIAFVLWFMSMDLTPIIFGGEDFSYDQRKWVSLFFGLCMLFGSYMVDLKTRNDFAFWGYLFGTLAFWCGLSLMDSNNELSKFVYFLINLAMIGLSIFLQRRVFVVFGGLGVMGYLYHLSSRLFDDSLSFSFALTIAGLLILYLGILITKHGNRIEAWVDTTLPAQLKKLRPVKQA